MSVNNRRSWTIWYWLGTTMLLIVAGCQSVGTLTSPRAESSTRTPTPAPQAPTEKVGESRGTSIDEKVRMALTYHQPDGNRVVQGQADLPAYPSVDVAFPSRPAWLGVLTYQGNLLWTVILDNGDVLAFVLVDGVPEFIDVDPPALPAETPPLLIGRSTDIPSLISPPADASPFTHPILPTTSDITIAYVSNQGDLVVRQGEVAHALAVNALPDARILTDEHNRLLLFTEPTDRYRHGVLGDAIEAGSITRVSLASISGTDEKDALETTAETLITFAPPDVAEGIAPIWADVDGDGSREIVATLSNHESGARLVVFDESGTVVAQGPAIGQGSRWRHQIGVAPLGPAGENEIVDVLTPHLGGVVEFYQWRGEELVIVARQPGYTSHVLGSRNLDMAAIGDFDGDDKLEVLLPTQNRRELGAIQHGAQGATVAWHVAIGGQMVTNLAIGATEAGMLAVGVGRADNTVRIWQPQP